MRELSGRTLAVIGAGLLQIPVIKSAKEMGIKTVVVDKNPAAPGISIGDFYINSSTLDAEATSLLIENFSREKQKIDGVLTVGTDASYTVAVCARKLGLPGIDPESALRATDKYLMRSALRAAKVPVPDFELVDSYQKAVEAIERLGIDCVVKPQKNMGARGVRRINNLDDLKEGLDLALRYSDSGKVIIEQYIDAPELSIDALVYNSEAFITGIADRIIEYDPYFVETGHIMPSNLPEDQLVFAGETFKNGIKSLGITAGAAKGDIKISSGSCFIGEIAARLSGGFMSNYTYPYSSGVNLMKNVILISLGYPPENLENRKKWVSIERSIIPAPGIIRSIKGIDKARKIEFVRDIFFDGKPGDKVISPQNNLDKYGHVIVSAPSYLEALKASHEAVRMIKVETREDDDQLISEAFISENARLKFNNKCAVCPDCDGYRCRGMIPGVGGTGNGNAFINAVKNLRKIEIIPRYINEAKIVDTSIDFFGLPLSFPIIPAPITGAITNLGGAIGELELARAVVKGANHAGVIGFLGDGATPIKYKLGIKVILENFGMAVPIFKPRFDNKLIFERIGEALKAGAIAVGMDIDAASFMTMEQKSQNTSTKTISELKELVEFSKVPFVLKGVLSTADAESALKAGVKALIVSNHGGRVNDNLVAPVDALPEIKKAVGNDAFLILDGGIRSGSDVLKGLALGANCVMIGRPVMIAAVGGGVQGVRQYLIKISNDLRKNMTFTGIKSISELINNRAMLKYV